MISQDMLGISAFVLVSMAFFLFGYNKKLFTLLCSGIILGYVMLIRQSTNSTFCWTESVVVMMGFWSYWFGLLYLRVMIARSVSLHMLLNPTSKEISADSLLALYQSDYGIEIRIKELFKGGG